MKIETIHTTTDFFAFGINHRLANLELREKYALNKPAYSGLLATFKDLGANDCFAVSTCNRTEIFGFFGQSTLLLRTYLSQINRTYSEFEQFGFILRAEAAMQHVFRVINGLDSKILGDYQIAGQFREAINTAQKTFLFSAKMERLVQLLFQSSKAVKSKTSLSTGATSAAFQTIKYLDTLPNKHEKTRLLLIGFGQMGKTILKYLEERENYDITILYRKRPPIQSEKYKIDSLRNLSSHLTSANIIIAASASDDFLIHSSQQHLIHKNTIIIDLGVPRNIDPGLNGKLQNSILTIDTLSQEKEQVMHKRKKSIEEAEQIIQDCLEEYYHWLDFTEFSPVIQSLRIQLNNIKKEELDKINSKVSRKEYQNIEHAADKILQKIFTYCMQHLRENKDLYATEEDPIRKLLNIS